jgi:hypothetical protein
MPGNYPEVSTQLEEKRWHSVMRTNSAVNQSAENLLGDACDEYFLRTFQDNPKPF